MITYEGIRLKVLKFKRIKFAKIRKRKLINKNFTIISNNCWGGMVYESYNIIKNSPTCGLFFMASDYIKFLKDLKGFINGDLNFINPDNSRWKHFPEIYEDKRFGSYPVGVLSNGKESIEIFFLHYQNEAEALTKWNRRCKRINWEKLLIKFNDQNGCDIQDLKDFLNLPYKNKLFFTCKKWPGMDAKEIIIINQFPKYKYIKASFEPFGKTYYCDVNKIINSL